MSASSRVCHLGYCRGGRLQFLRHAHRGAPAHFGTCRLHRHNSRAGHHCFGGWGTEGRLLADHHQRTDQDSHRDGHTGLPRRRGRGQPDYGSPNQPLALRNPRFLQHLCQLRPGRTMAPGRSSGQPQWRQRSADRSRSIGRITGAGPGQQSHTKRFQDTGRL